MKVSDVMNALKKNRYQVSLLGLNTPCAVLGDDCHDCFSPERICNGLLIQWKKMNDIDMEMILINEELGF